jgi:Cd2+/Zn2+-exporting ATPase
MVSRFADLSVYKEILKTGDFIRAALGAVLIVVALFLGRYLQVEDMEFFVSLPLIASIGLNGVPIIAGAVKGLLKKKINVDELVSIAVIACLATGHFLEGAVVCAIMVFGALIEEAVSGSARKEIEKLVALTPKEAVIEDAGEERRVDIALVKTDDIVVVRAGEIIPLDGRVTSGSSAVDESSITGESIPVFKQEDDSVSAGTLVQDGYIKLLVTKTSENSTISKVIRLIHDAENSDIDSSRIVDRYAKWFTPVILGLAVLTWILTRDIVRATTVLIVGCPCSFLLTGPVTTVAAVGRAARAGILVKGGQYLENTAAAEAVFFDKTGTLTSGIPEVVSVEPLNGMKKEEILRFAAAVERGSSHPLGKAIVGYADAKGIEAIEADDIRTVAGAGISGRAGGREVFIGGGGIQAGGYTTVEVRVDGTPAGVISLQDLPRKEAAGTLHALKNLGIDNLTIISGDQENAVRSVADAVGASAYRSGVKPEEKLRFVQDHYAIMVYAGDGINDAPALKAADVGIAMGLRGSDIALETADIVLLKDRIEKLPFLVRLSRRMTVMIKFKI